MAKSDLSAITEVVPQISYDIVGRIIPGITVIVCLLVAVMGPNQALTYLDRSIIHPNPTLSGWAVVLLVIAAYILAVILDGFWQTPACIRRQRQRCPPSKPSLEAPSTSLKFDVVNQKLPKAGAWFTKLYAETNLAQVLIIGWSISAAINFYFLITDFSSERLWFEVILIAATVGAVAVRDSISTTHEDSLDNLWLFLHSDQFTTSVGQTTMDESSDQ